MSKKQCTGLFDHSIGKMKTIGVTKKVIHKMCTTCGYKEDFPHSNSGSLFVNNLLVQKKRWAIDDDTKAMLQPLNQDGSINDDFTSAYGYNPYDERTKKTTPKFMGGEA